MIETQEFPESIKNELRAIFRKREVDREKDRADYWRKICFISWAVMVAALVVWLSKGALPYG